MLVNAEDRTPWYQRSTGKLRRRRESFAFDTTHLFDVCSRFSKSTFQFYYTCNKKERNEDEKLQKKVKVGAQKQESRRQPRQPRESVAMEGGV